MSVTYTKYKEARLHNNCPECYASQSLVVTFSHKINENKLFKRSSKEVKTEIYCDNCDTVIYPGRWTDDIERVYEYNRKLAEPPRPFFKFKPFSLILMLGIILVGIALAFLIIRNQ